MASNQGTFPGVADGADYIHPPVETWQRRFEAARALLDDTAHVAALARTCPVPDDTSAPRADVLAGAVDLHAAHSVGVLAGSYNPLTLAHLALAAAARAHTGLDLVVWTMAAMTVDKERVERAAVADRLAQLEALAAAGPCSAVARTNHGLYVDQARAFRAQLAPGARLSFVVGFDKIVQIFDPRYYTQRDAALAELFTLTDVLVAPRAGMGASALANLLAQPENVRFAPHVRFLAVPDHYTQDSSTEVRALASETSEDKAASSDRLRALAPAEGIALVATGAYHAEGISIDRYSWRERWLRALSAWDDAALAGAPSLSLLTAIAAESSARGALARRWLAAPDGTPAPGLPATPRELFAALI
jgi:nicotinic acid mononucleotide adenylyltransferase